MGAERKSAQALPPEPGSLREQRHTFFRSDRVEIWAVACCRYSLFRSEFPQPGQENFLSLGGFAQWRDCFKAGERAARFEEQIVAAAELATSFEPSEKRRRDCDGKA